MIQIDIDKPARCIDCPLCVDYDCILQMRIIGFYTDDLQEQYRHCPLIPVNPHHWCTDCKEYDHEKHCCHRFNQVIRTALDDAQPEIVRCKECRWGREVCGNIECFVDSNIPPEYHGYEWFCPNGERI